MTYISTQEKTCGRATIKVTLTFVPYPQGGPEYKVSKTTSVGIQPPNGIKIATNPSPFGVDVAIVPFGQGPNWPVKMYVQGDGRTLYLGVPVYEQITRNPYPNRQLPWGDQPMNVGPYISFTGPGEITDMKGNAVDPLVYAGYVISPPPLDEFTQTIALDIPYGCGGYVEGGKYRIAQFHMRMDKTDPTHWKLVLVQ